jgi:antitoxin VapB
MGLNIKNPEAEAVVRELAERTGEGLTEAIVNAAREKLDRLRTKGAASPDDFLASLRPLQKAIAEERALRGDTRKARDLMDEIYDERGLPK